MSIMRHDAPHEPGYWLLNELEDNPYTGKRHRQHRLAREEIIAFIDCVIEVMLEGDLGRPLNE
jgi:hypothetical protein